MDEEKKSEEEAEETKIVLRALGRQARARRKGDLSNKPEKERGK